MTKIKNKNEKSFIKVPSDKDIKVHNILNRYFKTVDTAEDMNHIEGVIRETTRRVKEQIQTEQSGKRLESTIEDVIRTILPEELNRLRELIVKDSLDLLRRDTAIIMKDIPVNITGAQHDVNIPGLTLDDRVIVTINGMLQNENANYELIDVGRNITGVRILGGELEAGVDKLQFLIFKNMNLEVN